jgi:pimeloyl-ACP methyl ester carboxylesterase
MAEDTIGLLDAIDLTSVHIAGHSMGGQIALELALACPGRVKSLILLSSCAKMDERGRTVIELWGDFPKLLDPATAIRLSFPAPRCREWVSAYDFILREARGARR